MKLTIEMLDGWDACEEGIQWFEAQDRRDLVDVLDALVEDGELEWANWLLEKTLTREQAIRYAIFAAEEVLPVFESAFPGDDRPRKAIEAAKRVSGNDTEKNRDAGDAARAARDAAWSDAMAARAAGDAAWSDAMAARAAWSAAMAARDAVRAAVLKKIVLFGIGLVKGER